MKVTIQVDGREEVLGTLSRFSYLAIGEVKAAVRDTAMIIVREAKKLARVRTGRMRSSIGASFENNGLAAIIGPSVDYAIDVEKGTQPHIIRPKRAKALRFSVGGEVRFANHVHHPGTKGSPFMYPAWELGIAQFRPRVQAALGRASNAAAGGGNANATSD